MNGASSVAVAGAVTATLHAPAVEAVEISDAHGGQKGLQPLFSRFPGNAAVMPRPIPAKISPSQQAAVVASVATDDPHAHSKSADGPRVTLADVKTAS